jgi:hypothetical protein
MNKSKNKNQNHSHIAGDESSAENQVSNNFLEEEFLPLQLFEGRFAHVHGSAI